MEAGEDDGDFGHDACGDDAARAADDAAYADGDDEDDNAKGADQGDGDQSCS